MLNKRISIFLGALIILTAGFLFFSPSLYLKYMVVLHPDIIIYQTNIQRVANGLFALDENKVLNEMANEKAKDMFAKQYFDHVSPNGFGLEDLAKVYKYDYAEVGENLLVGVFYDEEQVLNAWMKSPAHRADILNNKFTEIGVAAVKGDYNGQAVWMLVQEFGNPR